MGIWPTPRVRDALGVLGMLLTLALVILFDGCGAARVGDRSENLARGNELARAVRGYAHDHEGRFPTVLGELTPGHVAADRWSRLLFAPPRSFLSGRPSPEYDWLYFGSLLTAASPRTLLLASPQALTRGSDRGRIVVFSDTTAQIVSEEQYQAELRRHLALVRAPRPAPP